MWFAGCFVAKLPLGQPPFPGKSGVDSQVEITGILGTPTRENGVPEPRLHLPFHEKMLSEVVYLISKLFPSTIYAGNLHKHPFPIVSLYLFHILPAHSLIPISIPTFHSHPLNPPSLITFPILHTHLSNLSTSHLHYFPLACMATHHISTFSSIHTTFSSSLISYPSSSTNIHAISTPTCSSPPSFSLYIITHIQ